MMTQATTLQDSFQNRWIWLYAVLLVFIGLSWTGLLDRLATAQIDDSLLNAGIMYGTARGINALVSMLQSSGVSAVVFSMSVREILDPINDLIERFSEVMTYALASLALQKILLVVSAHPIFNILLTLAALGVIAGKVLGRVEILKINFKTFCTLVFLRLAFALVILLNMVTDSLFLEEQTAQKYQDMTLYEQEISSISNELTGSNATNQEVVRQLQTEVASTQEKQHALQTKLDVKKQAIAQQEQALDQRENEVGKIRSLYSDDEHLAALKADASQLRAEYKQLEADAEELEKQLAGQKDALDCAVKNSRGESCNVMDWIRNKSGQLNVKAKIESLNKNVTNFIDSTLTLLTLMILKAIIFPILFWVLLYQIFKKIWRVELKLT